MLAGRMKLNHFLLIAFALAAGGITVAYFGCRDTTATDAPKSDPRVATGNTARPAQPEPARPRPATPDRDTGAQPTGTAGGDTGGDASTRAVDRDVMKWIGKDLGGDKRKDVTSGKGYKVNLYQDKGHDVMNRAKIDLDRDDKWDEKWTFDGDEIARKVAPADDEKYTESYQWNGEAWVAR